MRTEGDRERMSDSPIIIVFRCGNRLPTVMEPEEAPGVKTFLAFVKKNRKGKKMLEGTRAFEEGGAHKSEASKPTEWKKKVVAQRGKQHGTYTQRGKWEKKKKGL